MADIVGPVVFDGVGGRPEPGNTTMIEHNALRAAELEADNGPRCLLERIGGREATIRITAGVYDRMKEHPELGPQFEKFAKTEATFQRLKDKTVEYLEGEWGGVAYDGPDLYISHSTFGIPVSMFDSMLQMFRAVLNDEQIVEPEFSEVLKSIDKMRGPMCDPGGTFAKEFNDRLESLTQEREDRVKYNKKHGIPYSKVSGWATDPKEREKYKALSAPMSASTKAKAESAPKSGPPKFTLAEVGENASSKSMWIVVDKKVYNVTSYMKDHPGGPGILKGVAGKDATKEFYKAHKPSQLNVKSVLKRLLIGSLVEEEKAPVVAKPVGGAKKTSTAPKTKGVDGDGTSKHTESGKTTKKASKDQQSSGELTVSTACSFSFDPEFDSPPEEPPAGSFSLMFCSR